MNSKVYKARNVNRAVRKWRKL